jgi:hypothetical protein
MYEFTLMDAIIADQIVVKLQFHFLSKKFLLKKFSSQLFLSLL